MSEVKAVESRLQVKNLVASLRFYSDILCFETETALSDFAILTNGSVRLQLAEEANRSAGSTSCLWLDVSDIDTLHRVISQHNTIEWGPELYDYGRQEFAILDPDGNLIIFSEYAGDDA